MYTILRQLYKTKNRFLVVIRKPDLFGNLPVIVNTHDEKENYDTYC